MLTTIGFLVPASAILVVGFIDCEDRGWAIALLCVGIGMTGTQFPGFYSNHIDIAPKYAGVLFGICNMIASMSGFLAPMVVAYFRKQKDLDVRVRWQYVFYICAACYTFAAIFYLIFGSGELQSWAQDDNASADMEMDLMNGEKSKLTGTKNDEDDEKDEKDGIYPQLNGEKNKMIDT